MERIVYRKTLDLHKNGVQFTLQGFETADRMSRVVEISLMASGDAIDFPLEGLVAMMYVTTPSATEPSINACTIKDNKVIYEVLPIVDEGITEMQIKFIETSIKGAKNILPSPKFAVEVAKSGTNDDGEELNTTFTASAIENFISKAETAYVRRIKDIELTSDCIFKVWYYDDSSYETDLLKKLFVRGDVKIAESFAKGGTGVRDGEDTDNSMYYSNVAKSAALNAKISMENSEAIRSDMEKQGVYTSFTVDFKTGEVEYVSPASEFEINNETGELVATRNDRSFQEAISDAVEDFLEDKGINSTSIKTNTDNISELQTLGYSHTEQIKKIKNTTTTIDKGGTGATTKEAALANLGALSAFTVNHTFNVDNNDAVNEDTIEFEQKPLFVIFPRAMMWDKMVYYGQASAYFNSGTSSNHVSSLTWGKNENGKYYLKINHSKYSNLRSMNNEPIIVIVDNSVYKP